MSGTGEPLRILLAALGGEGGGVLMNWIVSAARDAGMVVQATSVPGVAQRTGSTSYYIEIARGDAVLGLVPMPGRVDVVVSSELVETARVMAAGFISPDRTVLISSTARTYSTAEKIDLGDGRYSAEAVERAAEGLARARFLLDLGQIATDNGTFVSATMFGALAGADVLPWDIDTSRAALGDGRSAKASRAGFDAAAKAVAALRKGAAEPVEEVPDQIAGFPDLPPEIAEIVARGAERCADYQDADYAQDYVAAAHRLAGAADLSDHRAALAVGEACRRLALWMAYEDVARVADLKTRQDRFDRIRAESGVAPDSVVTITEYMKPRAEEIADIMPAKLGARIMARVERGGWFPFLGRGIHIRSNGVIGYRLLRTVAALRRIRRRSYRFAEEQAAIAEWLAAMETTLPTAPEFAGALAELPRVLKGYSDTLMRGKAAYARIMEAIVRPALARGPGAEDAAALRRAIAAALADDSHAKLDAELGGEGTAPAVPDLRAPA